MGDEVRRETGNDVFKSDPQLNEWMQRVKKLGGATDVDDDERSKRLEEVNNPPAKDKSELLGNHGTEKSAKGTAGG